MKNAESFGIFWQLIYDEFVLTKSLFLKIAGYTSRMENYSDGIASIKMR